MKINQSYVKAVMLMAILLVCNSLLIGCGQGKIEVIKRDTYALGTYIQMTIMDQTKEDGNRIIDLAIKRINDIENEISVNKKNSKITEVNKNAGVKSVVVGDDAYYIIKKAYKYEKMTNGDFDISIYPLVKLWGIGTDYPKLPTSEEIKEKMDLINYKNVIINEDKSIFLENKKQGIDLGGIAKGYIADEVKKVLRENGVESGVINLGGNIMTIGSKMDGTDWKIGIQNPDTNRGQYFSILDVKDKSIISSGGYERYFDQDGTRYHHILDPKTGYPSNSDLIGTTIISDYGIDGDALSTSVYISGLEKGIELINKLEGIECILVTKDKKVYVSEGIKDDIVLDDDTFKFIDK
ncbi:FAD:protein FMN transferase [Lutibacter sp. B2]|nr:FAD:protein FMN transferase [Lutibacter sp. B2]